MKIALCLIARLENKYLREYVEYYKSLGFDNIFIYDNNRPNEESLTDEIQDFVDDGFIIIRNWPIYEGNAQKPAYQHCFNKYRNDYDWIAFFDADEYLCLNEGMDIKEILSNPKFDNFGGVAISSVNYDDNDLIINNSKTRLDKYTRPVQFKSKTFYKTIVRCKKNNVNFYSKISDGCHLAYMNNNKICDIDGVEVPWNNILCKGIIKDVYLKHIPTGCIDDYIIKDFRKWPDTNNPRQFSLDFFKEYNTLTQEKMDYFLKKQKK